MLLWMWISLPWEKKYLFHLHDLKNPSQSSDINSVQHFFQLKKIVQYNSTHLPPPKFLWISKCDTLKPSTSTGFDGDIGFNGRRTSPPIPAPPALSVLISFAGCSYPSLVGNQVPFLLLKWQLHLLNHCPSTEDGEASRWFSIKGLWRAAVKAPISSLLFHLI